MKAVVKLKRVAFLLVFILWVCDVSPWLYGFVRVPLRVRFTGVLLPSKDQSRKGVLEDLDVLIGKEKRTFLLDKMKIVGSVGVNRAILQRLFPPLVRFVGLDELIGRLKNPEIVGKVLTVEGFLYPESRIFFLTEVDEGEADGTN
jgi:hypothetical protein